MENFYIKECLVILESRKLFNNFSGYGCVLTNHHKHIIFANIGPQVERCHIIELDIVHTSGSFHHRSHYGGSMANYFVQRNLLVRFFSIEKLFDEFSNFWNSTASTDKNYLINFIFLKICLHESFLNWW